MACRAAPACSQQRTPRATRASQNCPVGKSTRPGPELVHTRVPCTPTPLGRGRAGKKNCSGRAAREDNVRRGGHSQGRDSRESQGRRRADPLSAVGDHA
ncbi:hypothetical protein BC628DRAFT_1357866 [Trametes gibbosa]|nr:hypothetical protein BC628DRAFT_1357866 [Trametes gibbosa]